MVLAVGLSMRYLANTQISDAEVTGLSARAVPLMVANAVMILSLVMIVQGVVLGRREARKEEKREFAVSFCYFPFLVFALMVVYAVLMQLVGYFVSSLLVLPAIVFLLEEKSIKNYLILLVMIIAVYVAFGIGLGIPLPMLRIS